MLDESTKLFTLRNAFKRGALFVSNVHQLPGGSELVRTGFAGPLLLCREVGRTPFDLVGGTGNGIILLSPRLLDVLGGRSLTGWTSFDVLIDSSGISGSVDGYRGLVVTGRCGPILRNQSRIEIRPTAVPGKTIQVKVGLHFPKESWDGSDFFMSMDGSGYILVTDRVRTAMVDAGMTNVAFELIEDHVFVR